MEKPRVNLPKIADLIQPKRIEQPVVQAEQAEPMMQVLTTLADLHGGTALITMSVSRNEVEILSCQKVVKNVGSQAIQTE